MQDDISPAQAKKSKFLKPANEGKMIFEILGYDTNQQMVQFVRKLYGYNG